MSLNVRNITQANITHALGEPEDTSTKDTVIGLLKRIHSSSTVNGETINDLIDEVDDLNVEIDNLKNQKANKVDVYTKQESDTLLQEKANKNVVYTTQQVDNLLAQKANQATTYTKTEVDNSLSLKADKSTTYTKTETDTFLSQKADKTDTYTKTQVDNLITGSTITNYVTTDTLQSITGTKMCGEIHANSLYTPDFVLNTKHFTTTHTNGTTNQDDKTLCSYAYISSMIQQNNQSYKQTIMDLCYPVNSIYLSWINYDLDGGETGNPIGATGTPLDYGTWRRLNSVMSYTPCVLGLTTPSVQTATPQGQTKLTILHLPDHAHQGIITYDGKKYSGSGSAAVPADDPDGNTSRTNWRCSTTNNVGTAHSTYFDQRGTQANFLPYGLYIFAFKKEAL